GGSASLNNSKVGPGVASSAEAAAASEATRAEHFLSWQELRERYGICRRGANDAAVVDKNNAEDEAAQSDAGERAAGSRRQSEMIGQSEWRSRDELDFSSQGLTMAPSSLFAKTHTSVLNLSSNNIRGLPPEISNLTQLRHLDLSRNGLRCASSEDFTSLPKEMETMAELRELLLSECSLMHIPRPSGPSLDQDSAGGDRLLRRSGEPSVVREPHRLAAGQPAGAEPAAYTLHINYRGVRRPGFDAETDGMLQRQQLTSEHIPSVVFHIPQLLEMDLEACKVNALPQESDQPFPRRSALSTSSPYDVSRNGFKTLPPALKDLRSPPGAALARHNQLTFMAGLAGLDRAHQFSGLFKRGLWTAQESHRQPPAKVWNTWDPAKIWAHQWSFAPAASWCSLVTWAAARPPWPAFSVSDTRTDKVDGSGLTTRFQLSSWRSENRCPFVLLEPAVTRSIRASAGEAAGPEGASLRCLRHRRVSADRFRCGQPWLRLLAAPTLPGARVQLIGTKLDTISMATETSANEILAGSLRSRAALAAESTAEAAVQRLRDSHWTRILARWPRAAFERTRIPELRLQPRIHLVSAKYVPTNWQPFMSSSTNESGQLLLAAAAPAPEELRALTGQNKLATSRPPAAGQPGRLSCRLQERTPCSAPAAGCRAAEYEEAREAALSRGQLSWPLVRCLAFGRGGQRQALVAASRVCTAAQCSPNDSAGSLACAPVRLDAGAFRRCSPACFGHPRIHSAMQAENRLAQSRLICELTTACWPPWRAPSSCSRDSTVAADYVDGVQLSSRNELSADFESSELAPPSLGLLESTFSIHLECGGDIGCCIESS
uniref:LRRCT domain-containing protein n=1 Tax=Macrostomum lignano TaxID=282301 RepID=A0A1I8F916_9PLAT